MQAVILAGGLGARISEESHLRPKPMVEIGGMPIRLRAAPDFDVEPAGGSVEVRSLAVDARRAQSELGWRNRLASASAIAWTADWHRRVRLGEPPRAVTLAQIEAYCGLAAHSSAG